MFREHIPFECLKCGECCKNLVLDLQGLRKGLFLLPDERKLFNKNVLKPALGKGKNPNNRNFKILAFQLTENICPHLKNSQCDIYNERPTSCRAYPVSYVPDMNGHFFFNFDAGCSLVSNIKGNKGDRVEITGNLHIEKSASQKIRKIERQASKNPMRAWYFDLLQNK